MKVELEQIAHIRSDFASKSGIPRQSGLVEDLRAEVIFEPEFRVPEAIRGIEGYTHLWLIWCFSESMRGRWSPTVRPPRLGGNARMGVFATRSPFRPNPVGLSSVRLLGVEMRGHDGHVLVVGGADLMDGTPIFDIKPYLSFVDSHPGAGNGFAENVREKTLEVVFDRSLAPGLDDRRFRALCGVLAQDPRPAYHCDPGRVYGFCFAGLDIRFRVEGNRLTVVEVCPGDGRAY